ncbi:MAG TPA: adenylate/guanylate cyclase domain-containing protein, partial [Isosphaeraceae bacterium]
MTAAIETLAPYVPALVLRRLAAEPAMIARQVRVPAAVLFTDISGFTKLTERLARGGPGGAETLSVLLNVYFEQLIARIAAHGGDVAKLAGDALIALWPAEAGETPAEMTLRAAQCGLAVHETLRDYEVAEGVCLSTKAGIACGEVVAMQVGGVLNRWELLLAGAPLVQMGVAEKQAEPGDVVLAPEAWDLVRDACTGTDIEHGCVRLEAIRRPIAPRPIEVPTPPEEAEAALLGYIPGAIRARLVAGQTEWLGELRRITVLFVNLPDLNPADRQAGPGVLERTQEVVRALQAALYAYEGSVNKLSVDEKGTTLVAALGLPPLAHEDDAIRGVQAALAMRAGLRELGVRCAIGVATGRVYCGEIGGAARREYTIIGDVVNLAARLMQKAGEGETGADGVLCDAATFQAAWTRLAFVPLPPVRLKGKADPVPVFRPEGRAAPEAGREPIVGRAPERTLLAERLDALGAG